MSEDKIRTYSSDDIDVHYSLKRCIHAAECVNRLSEVFNTSQRPWIQPQNAAADDVAETILHCPTGALHYDRKHGGASEPTPEENMVRIAADGPLYVRGDVTVTSAAGDVVVEDTRMALCRCGASENKPLCDNSHIGAGFKDPGTPAEHPDSDPSTSDPSALNITPAKDGPLLLKGDFEIVDAKGESVYIGTNTALCRCGASSNKPFCDGTHKQVGFTAD